MTGFVALLRAVNVGGTGKLAMEDLRGMAADAGFRNPATYIASGNLVLESDSTEAEVKGALEQRLADYAGKPVGVLVRSAAEMQAIARDNPFAAMPPRLTVAIFLDSPPPADLAAQARGRDDEEIVSGAREVYVYYPGGQGRSKLRIPAAAQGTARNMNTVARLAEMAAALAR